MKRSTMARSPTSGLRIARSVRVMPPNMSSTLTSAITDGRPDTLMAGFGGSLSAAEIAICPDRKLARAAGIVTCRQRPGTAKGTMFITLEDETGWINVVVRPELLETERQILLGACLLGVYGQITRQGSVVHLQAKRVVDRSAQLGRLAPQSRDFH